MTTTWAFRSTPLWTPSCLKFCRSAPSTWLAPACLLAATKWCPRSCPHRPFVFAARIPMQAFSAVSGPPLPPASSLLPGPPPSLGDAGPRKSHCIFHLEGRSRPWRTPVCALPPMLRSGLPTGVARSGCSVAVMPQRLRNLSLVSPVCAFPERGLHELEPCKKTSNTVCACLPGHSPAKDTLGESERRCDPCPSGYFSRGGKERCRPWTNCTAYGQKTLRAGKRDEDAICSEPPTRVPRQTAIVVPSSLRQGPGTATTTSSSTLTTSATQPGRDRPKEQRDGLLIIFLTSAGLLLVVGLVIFLLFRQKAKKKDSAVFTNVPHEGL
ncbi:tumor necrosis factor receptor superfamily member 4 isoform X2 [Varanus komodoensis]|uniref:tumor necrosis factor receptor superfamily member 4 isoform X2 n=1 Tax=Varanus komodoensis TaxID=61221 RepID=UPI001CF7A46F|nr:tumor necrosis factor receptor superfamily member 4 isoform X2 [Varanus komodoensis]